MSDLLPVVSRQEHLVQKEDEKTTDTMPQIKTNVKEAVFELNNLIRKFAGFYLDEDEKNRKKNKSGPKHTYVEIKKMLSSFKSPNPDFLKLMLGTPSSGTDQVLALVVAIQNNTPTLFPCMPIVRRLFYYMSALWTSEQRRAFFFFETHCSSWSPWTTTSLPTNVNNFLRIAIETKNREVFTFVSDYLRAVDESQWAYEFTIREVRTRTMLEDIWMLPWPYCTSMLDAFFAQIKCAADSELMIIRLFSNRRTWELLFDDGQFTRMFFSQFPPSPTTTKQQQYNKNSWKPCEKLSASSSSPSSSAVFSLQDPAAFEIYRRHQQMRNTCLDECPEDLFIRHIFSCAELDMLFGCFPSFLLSSSSSSANPFSPLLPLLDDDDDDDDNEKKEEEKRISISLPTRKIYHVGTKNKKIPDKKYHLNKRVVQYLMSTERDDYLVALLDRAGGVPEFFNGLFYPFEDSLFSTAIKLKSLKMLTILITYAPCMQADPYSQSDVYAAKTWACAMGTDWMSKSDFHFLNRLHEKIWKCKII